VRKIGRGAVARDRERAQEVSSKTGTHGLGVRREIEKKRDREARTVE